jgi:hypothetical protein
MAINVQPRASRAMHFHVTVRGRTALVGRLFARFAIRITTGVRLACTDTLRKFARARGKGSGSSNHPRYAGRQSSHPTCPPLGAIQSASAKSDPCPVKHSRGIARGVSPVLAFCG